MIEFWNGSAARRRAAGWPFQPPDLDLRGAEVKCLHKPFCSAGQDFCRHKNAPFFRFPENGDVWMFYISAECSPLLPLKGAAVLERTSTAALKERSVREVTSLSAMPPHHMYVVLRTSLPNRTDLTEKADGIYSDCLFYNTAAVRDRQRRFRECSNIILLFVN